MGPMFMMMRLVGRNMMRLPTHVCRRLTSVPLSVQRERLDYDVVIVGAGPAGLSAAIRLRQLAQEAGKDYSVCVLDKAAEIGGHILSGNVFEPRALDELLPDWTSSLTESSSPGSSSPCGVPVTRDRFSWLPNSRHSITLPVPPGVHNRGNIVLSLSELTRWLGEQAEAYGVEIYPGFAAKEMVLDSHGAVNGVITHDFGIAKDGTVRDNYQPGVEIRGMVTLLAEGARGSLTKQVVSRFQLRQDRQEQTYGLGVKEVWRVDPSKYEPGSVLHTVGWPLDWKTYGGSFVYHMSDSRVSIGMVVGLDYPNPYLSPYQEFQKLKTHRMIQELLDGGEVLQYGARTLNEGGLQSLPKLGFPGGALIGCAAGFLNVLKIKGTHLAMKSGMLAAESTFRRLQTRDTRELEFQYEANVMSSWIGDELRSARNIRPAFSRLGLYGGMAHAALDTFVFRGRAPWTLSHPHKGADYVATEPASRHQPPTYPQPDGRLVFDILDSVALSGTDHDHNQPVHLTRQDVAMSKAINYDVFAGPEGRYCPAKVYEYNEQDAGTLTINAQNCLHCKACDIKDPAQNITWTTPEGGGGPKYSMV
mmetsp:Transcript_6421/g.12821  ORF Transcript_6421/g.12821 Transcript_6421/m.12821 type:complete len:588 (+) Transcript_6421:32-1795(+)